MAPIQRMVHRNWLFLLMIPLLLLPMSIRAEVPEAEELFQKLVQSFETVDFEGKLTIMTQVPMGNPVLEAHVIRKSPDKWRIEFIWPDEVHGTGIVMNGKDRWPIFRDRKPGDRKPRDRESRRRPFLWRPPNRIVEEFILKNFQLVRQNYDIRILDGGSIAGRNTYLAEVESRTGGRPSRKIWLDAEMGVILKVENYDSQRKPRGFFTYSEIKFDPEIDTKVFLEPPRKNGDRERRKEQARAAIWNYDQGVLDLDKIREEVELDVIIPDQPPAGFVLQSIDTLKLGKQKNIHLKYTDGLAVVSVFQSSDKGHRGPRREGRPPWRDTEVKKVTIGEAECEVVSRGPMVIFMWNQGNVYLTLMGELEQKEMAKIVSSFVSDGR